MKMKFLSFLVAFVMLTSLSASVFAAPQGQSGNPVPVPPPVVNQTPSVTAPPTTTPATTPAPPPAFVPEVAASKDEPKTVGTKEIIKVVEAAISNAIKNLGAGSTAKVTLENVSIISNNALQAAAKAAADKGVKAVLNVEQKVDGKVVAVITIDPAKAVLLKNDIDLTVKTDNKETREVFKKYFENEIAIASFGQKGAFGINIDIMIKPENLGNLNTEKLMFYTYDATTGIYNAIEGVKYTMYTDGSIKFNTPVGGDIIITDKVLQAK